MITKFGVVGSPFWTSGRDIFIVGGGPSLMGRDLSGLRDRGYVIGINKVAETVPVDMTFSLDLKFMREYRLKIASWARDHEVYLAVPTENAETPIDGPIYLERVQTRGLCWDRNQIANGLNSGYGGLNAAVHKVSNLVRPRRVTRIYLLGFDMTQTRGGPTHWHGGYEWNNGSAEKYYDRWAERFLKVAQELEGTGINVINASPDSAIRAFPFTTYEELGL